MNPCVSENIQFMCLYSYNDKFIIESDSKATGIKTNLIINRQTHQV